MTATPRPGQAPPPDRTTYRVTYTAFGEVREDEVTVVPGYSQESDIPRILAARHTGRPPGRDPGVVVLGLRELRPQPG
ncbi:hypothetical protein [Streptomyces sp. NRRL S-350]|uniref:hypothetical protein n=1 Tax=Streptomyces sp. NRRL S-350 TaxID=1463902 RepID=UPI0004C1C3E3|nr:hypothetical protein [Streptomyces sp. NRRL S-350]